MYATERHELIAARVRDDGRVAVRQLARELDVTAETIRRDLDLLEGGGLLRRVHGGAVASGRSSIVERSLEERRTRDVDVKRRIAGAAMRLIPDSFDGSILLDAGTTTGALAELLRDRRGPRPLPVITNSVHIAATLAPSSEVEVHQLGGRVRGITAAAVGSETVAAVERMRPDIAVIGTNGVSAAFGLSTPDEFEAAVKSAFVRAGRRVVMLADGSKLDDESLIRFAVLGEIDALVTDQAPDGALAAALDDAEVEVMVA